MAVVPAELGVEGYMVWAEMFSWPLGKKQRHYIEFYAVTLLEEDKNGEEDSLRRECLARLPVFFRFASADMGKLERAAKARYIQKKRMINSSSASRGRL